MKFIAITVLAGLMSVMIYSCSKSDTSGGGGNTNTDHKVNIQASIFDPATITMLPSARLTWTNMDTQPHTVVSDDLISFNSGNINAGGTYSFTPTATGIHEYHCGLHPTVKGTIYVVIR
ncbi:MAG: cupredoxin domain-containing protein [Ferruginibacter sp.]